MKVNTDLYVEVPPVPRVGVHLELSVDLLPLFAGHVVTQVESSLKSRYQFQIVAIMFNLLPVSVCRIRSSREPGLLVTFGKLYVEKRYQGLWDIQMNNTLCF